MSCSRTSFHLQLIEVKSCSLAGVPRDPLLGLREEGTEASVPGVSLEGDVVGRAPARSYWSGTPRRACLRAASCMVAGQLQLLPSGWRSAPSKSPPVCQPQLDRGCLPQVGPQAGPQQLDSILEQKGGPDDAPLHGHGSKPKKTPLTRSQPT